MVVPVARDLLDREQLAPFHHYVEAVQADELEQLDVAMRLGELDDRLGTGTLEPALVHQEVLLLAKDDLADVRALGKLVMGP
jgi:hypothetical protein